MPQLPSGARILTSPSQISGHRILGQVGKIGERGSYLYGIPRELPQAPTSEAINRQLPSSQGVQPNAFENPPQQMPNSQQLFNDTVMAMLRAAQGAGNEDLEAKRNAIIQARFNAQRQATPEELRVLSPQAQASIRSLDVAGLEEQLGGTTAALSAREKKRVAQREAAQTLFNVLLKQQELEQKVAVPAKKDTQVITAGQRSLLIDSQTGEVIKDLGYAYKTDTGAEIQTRDGVDVETDKVSTVTQGQFDDPNYVKKLPVSDITKSIIVGYGTLKELTPSQKGQVQAELYRVGFDPKSYILVKLNDMVQMYKDLPSHAKGLIEGNIPANLIISGAGEAAAFDSARIVLTRQVARLYDVGMLSDQDVADYKKAMPARSDRNAEVVEKKVGGLQVAIGIRQVQQKQFSVKAPNGKTYFFNTQKELDAFKKAAKIK